MRDSPQAHSANAASPSDAYWQASIAAALLRSMRWASALTLILLFVCLLRVGHTNESNGLFIASALSLTVGLIGVYFSTRVELDARLFDRIAQRNAPLQEFDRAMLELGLMKSDKLGRALAQRIRGALRLARWQIALLVVQLAATLSSLR